MHTGSNGHRLGCLTWLAVFSCVVVKPPLTFGSRQAPAASDTDELIATILDASRPGREKDNAFLELVSLGRADRHIALRQITERAEEDYAWQAGVHLLRSRADDASTSIVRQLAKWSEKSQAAVVAEAQLWSDDAAQVELARGILRSPNPVAAAQPAKFERDSASGIAAIILAKSATAADVELVRLSLRSNPRCYGLWLAYGWAAGLNESDRQLAKSLLDDTMTSDLLRSAVSVATCRSNGTDCDAAERTITAILSQPIEPRSVDVSTLLERSRKLRILGMLGFVRADWAETVTFANIAGADRDIRRVLGLVACYRWPERLLREKPAGVPGDEYAQLVALCVDWHPELRERAEAVIGKDALNSASEALVNFGWGVVFGVDNVGAVLGW